MRRNFKSYLIDLSRVTSSDVDIGGVMMIFNKANAQDFGQNSGTLPFILAPDEKNYGHSRQFQSLADTRGGVQIHISDSEAAALTVLDRPETDLESFLTGQSDCKPK